MKKRLTYIFLATIVALTACDFEVSDNGDLDGYWQLHQTDTLATGGTDDMHQSGIYWAFQVHLMEMRDLQSRISILYRFEHSGSQLRIYNPIANYREVSDSVITDVSLVNRYGIEHLDELFHIEQLNSDNMILTNDTYRFHLRKY